MDESYRLFNCARCHSQVKICRRCDHGNIYCPECAEKAEQERLLRAGAKYQRTERAGETTRHGNRSISSVKKR